MAPDAAPDVALAVAELRAWREVNDAVASLARDGITPVLTGGRLLVGDLRGAVIRRSVDAALLVRREEEARARDHLSATGWQPGNPARAPVQLERRGARIRLQTRVLPGSPRTVAERRLQRAVRARAAPDRHGLHRPDAVARLLLIATFELLVADRPYDPWDVTAALDALDQSELDEAAALAERVGVGPALRYACSLRDAVTTGWLPAPPESPFGLAVDSAIHRAAATVHRVRQRMADAQAARPRRFCDLGDLRLEVPVGVYDRSSPGDAVAHDALTLLPEVAHGRLVDVGTGAGHVAVVLARARPGLSVVGTDVSARAVAAARRNARRLGTTNASFVTGPLLDPLLARPVRDVTMVVSTLPYLGPRHPGGPHAVWGAGPGFDGLDLVRRLAVQATRLLTPGGHLVALGDEASTAALRDFLTDHGYVDITFAGRTIRARWDGRQ